MDIYVLDARFFVLCRDYYPDTFPSLWAELDSLATNQKITSVEQVYDEIDNYGGKQEHLLEWMKTHKDKMFRPPTIEEQDIVREIFETEDYQKLINKKDRLRYIPSADPFVIARARHTAGTVVTGELGRTANNAPHKIPDICQDMGLKCITPQQFMNQQGWRF